MSATGPGQFHPFALVFQGPEEVRDLLESGAIAVPGADPLMYTVVESGDWMALANSLGEKPAALLLLDFNRPGNLDEVLGVRSGVFNAIKGFGVGLVDAARAVFVDGAVEIAECAWYLHQNYRSHIVGFRLADEGRVLTIEDRQRVDAIAGTAQELGALLLNHQSGDLYARLTGQEDEFRALGAKYNLAVMISIELIEEALEHFETADDFTRGRVIGRISGEASLVVMGALVGGEFVLSRADAIRRVLQRLRDVPDIAGDAALMARFEAVEERAAAVAAEVANTAGEVRLEAETVLTIYRRVRDAGGPGENAAAAMRQALDEFAAAVGRETDSESIVLLVRTAMKEFYENPPRLPDGSPDFEKMSYRYFRQLLQGRLRDNNLQVHHVIPRKWLERIYELTYPGRPLPADGVLELWQDQSPCFPMPRSWHNRGNPNVPNTSTVHGKIAEVMARPRPPGQQPTVQTILEDIRTAYTEYQAANGSPFSEELVRALNFAEQWLNSPQGLPGAP